MLRRVLLVDQHCSSLVMLFFYRRLVHHKDRKKSTIKCRNKLIGLRIFFMQIFKIHQKKLATVDF